MAAPPGADAWVRRVERIAGQPLDDRSLRSRLLDALREDVAFDAHAWVLTDPETSVGSSPLAAVPDLTRLPSLVRAKYLTEVNRWTRLGDRFASLHAVTGGELARSRVWREEWRSFDVSDVASGVFRDRYGCWAFLDLWRVGSARPFTAAELAHLDSALGILTEALRRSQSRTFVTEGPTSGMPGPVVLVLDEDLRVLAETEQTTKLLGQLLPTPEDRQPIPAAAYNVAAQLLARREGVDPGPPSARVHAGRGRWMTLRAAHLADPAGARIAVTIETISPRDRADLFIRVHALTARESELLGLLAAGLATRAVAHEMNVSEHTVQDHLKAVFAKTGVRNRRSLLTRVRGS